MHLFSKQNPPFPAKNTQIPLIQRENMPNRDQLPQFFKEFFDFFFTGHEKAGYHKIVVTGS